MKSREKQMLWIPAMVGWILLAMAAGCAAEHFRGKSRGTVIYFGMNAGSYWDVPTGSCYEVIDAAIRRFEEKHPGVKVTYTSGILKEDYPEWLAEQILLGKEPDVFMVPAGQLDILASMGVLKDLGRLMEADKEFEKEEYYPAAWQYGNIRNTPSPSVSFVTCLQMERKSSQVQSAPGILIFSLSKRVLFTNIRVGTLS